MKKPTYYRQLSVFGWIQTLRWLTFFVTAVLASLPAHAAMYVPKVDYARMERLLSLKFPPVNSGIQCHGTAMAVTDVLSMIMPLGLDEAYFSGSCFREVEVPQAGDYGRFLPDQSSSMNEAFHTFTVLNDHQIFQKANPGWDKYPFELISISSLKDIRAYMPENREDRLVWTRYTPSPSCLLT